MVVIIDDRGDVWQWSPNLIKVIPYDFFVGIGDINSSFLPKKSEITSKTRTPLPPPPFESSEDKENTSVAEDVEALANGETISADADAVVDADASSLETQLVAMAGGDDPSVMEEQSNAQAETIAAQVTDRPLMKKQEMLDKMDGDDETKENSKEEQTSDTASEHSHKHRQNLLHDDDEELRYLQANLEHVHKLFFEEYDHNIASSAGGRVAQLRGEKSSKKPPLDNLELVPDVKDIMPPVKLDVLKDVVICFTGVIPQGLNHET
jgi:RNA polymerase II subunit A C-terminal domain phosphatase